jgi:predicted secreted hydrolase
MKKTGERTQRALAAAALALLMACVFTCAAAGKKTTKKPAPQPKPKLENNLDFQKKQGAHYENSFENWQVTGTLADNAGNKYDFTAVFAKVGSVFMNIRHGFASLNDPAGAGYRYTSFAPGTLSAAALKELAQKQKLQPDNQLITQAYDRIVNKMSPEFDMFDAEAIALRNNLSLDYCRDSFHRTASDTFDFTLNLDVRGTQLKLSLHAGADPVQFNGDNTIPIGDSGAFTGYEFPRMDVKGTIIKTDKKEYAVTGGATLLQFWGEPSRGAFGRYTIITMPLDGGASLTIFNFLTPDGAPLSRYALYADAAGEKKLLKDFKLKELDYWTSPALSHIKYPVRWRASGGGFSGEIALSDTLHEVSIIEGLGAFYIGPCGFKGTANKKKTAAAGACRLVAPENW